MEIGFTHASLPVLFAMTNGAGTSGLAAMDVDGDPSRVNQDPPRDNEDDRGVREGLADAKRSELD